MKTVRTELAFQKEYDRLIKEYGEEKLKIKICSYRKWVEGPGEISEPFWAWVCSVLSRCHRS